MTSFNDDPLAVHAISREPTAYDGSTSRAHRAVEKRIRQLDTAMSDAELEPVGATSDLSGLALDNTRHLSSSLESDEAGSPNSTISEGSSSLCSSADTSAGDFELYRWLFDQGVKTIRPGSPPKLHLPDVPSCPLLRGASNLFSHLHLDSSSPSTNDDTPAQSQQSLILPTPALSDVPTLNTMPSLRSLSSRTSSRRAEPLRPAVIPSLSHAPSVAASLEIRSPMRPLFSLRLAQRAELLKTPQPRPTSLEHQHPKYSPNSPCEVYRHRSACSTPRKLLFSQPDASLWHWRQEVSMTEALGIPLDHGDQFADADEEELMAPSLPPDPYESAGDSSVDGRTYDEDDEGRIILADMNDVFSQNRALQHHHSSRAMSRFRDVLGELRLRQASVFSSRQSSRVNEVVVEAVAQCHDASPSPLSTPVQETSTPPRVNDLQQSVTKNEQSSLAVSLIRRSSLYDSDAKFSHGLGIRLEQLASRNRLTATQTEDTEKMVGE